MRFERNIKPCKKGKGYWSTKARDMKINVSYSGLSFMEAKTLTKALTRVGFKGRREKQKNGKYRVWRLET